MLNKFLALALSLALASPASAKVWNIEKSRTTMPDTISAEIIKAKDGDGLQLQDDGGNLGVTIEDGGDVGIGTTNPTTNLHVSSGTANFKMATIDLVDDGTYAMETDFGSQGMVIMASDSVGRSCGWMLGGGGNSVTAHFDGASVCAEADTDGFFAMFADGDGTYTLRNRIGASQGMAIFYIGF